MREFRRIVGRDGCEDLKRAWESELSWRDSQRPPPELDGYFAAAKIARMRHASGSSNYLEAAIERLNEAIQSDRLLEGYLAPVPDDGIFSEEELPRRREVRKRSKDDYMRSILRERLDR